MWRMKACGNVACGFNVTCGGNMWHVAWHVACGIMACGGHGIMAMWLVWPVSWQCGSKHVMRHVMWRGMWRNGGM
jgi:hypothetical protein